MHCIQKYRFTALLACFGIFCGCLFAYCQMIVSQQPAIQLSRSEINFGKIAAGTKVSQTIEVKNVGTGILIIQNIKSGCGCAQVELSQSEIAPNETAQLRIFMDATEYGQKTFILLLSNDPQSPITEVSVSSDAVMQTIVEPAVIDFGQIKDTEELPISKTINVNLNENIFPEKESDHLTFFTDHPYLKLDISNAAAQSKAITLTLPSDIPIGEISTELQIQSSLQTVSVRVIGTIRGQFYSLPPTVLFHQVEQDDAAISQTVEIRCRYNNGTADIPKIDSFELSHSIQSLLSASLADGNKIVLKFSPSPDMLWSPSTINGTICVKCSSGLWGSKTVHIPLQISLRVPKVRR